MIHKHNLSYQPRSVQKKPLVLVAAAFLIAIVIGAGGYFQRISNYQSSPPSQPSTQPAHNQSTSWKIFTAPMEKFTLRYPDTWIVKDVTIDNCGHKTGVPDGRGSYCKDSFNFVAPDGLTVRYVIIGDDNDDRAGCGTQSVCMPQQVDNIETANISGLGDVLLVKLGKVVRLHKPVDSGTMPVVGGNKHPNYMIDFTLPSKAGGRFSLFLTPFYSPKLRDALTNEQYYNLVSVQQGIQILKSLQYLPHSLYMKKN